MSEINKGYPTSYEWQMWSMRSTS